MELQPEEGGGGVAAGRSSDGHGDSKRHKLLCCSLWNFADLILARGSQDWGAPPRGAAARAGGGGKPAPGIASQLPEPTGRTFLRAQETDGVNARIAPTQAVLF